MPRLSSAIARKRPNANEIRTVDVAKTTVQAKTRRNGPRYSGSVKIFEKFREPTKVFHPGSSSFSIVTARTTRGRCRGRRLRR